MLFRQDFPQFHEDMDVHCPGWTYEWPNSSVEHKKFKSFLNRISAQYSRYQNGKSLMAGARLQVPKLEHVMIIKLLYEVIWYSQDYMEWANGRILKTG
jgi:hypothetical protein